jgi:hypothetical protein
LDLVCRKRASYQVLSGSLVGKGQSKFYLEEPAKPEELAAQNKTSGERSETTLSKFLAFLNKWLDIMSHGLSRE